MDPMMNPTARAAVTDLCADLATTADVDYARADLRTWAAANTDDPAAGVAVAVRTGMLDQHRAALLEHFERFKPAP
jgi:hypothetical protein